MLQLRLRSLFRVSIPPIQTKKAVLTYKLRIEEELKFGIEGDTNVNMMQLCMTKTIETAGTLAFPQLWK